MNRDSKELARRINVMLAYQNGEDMEYCKPDVYGWTNLTKKGTVSFNWSAYDYRAKPKGREWTFEMNTDGTVRNVLELGEEPWFDKTVHVKVREVLSE